MFTLYYSNQLETQKDILLHLMDQQPLSDPFQKEVILVQSGGMAQWIQWQIAEKKGISANLSFPMPASFIWQLYVDNLSQVTASSQFSKENMTWRLMEIIPHYIDQPEFYILRQYLQQSYQSSQQRYYQLASKIAELFDQYLVYRPEWIISWEQNKGVEIIQQIQYYQKNLSVSESCFSQVEQHIVWQGILWRALVCSVQKETQKNVLHRAHLHLLFLKHIAGEKPKNLPTRIFVFGISALPKVHLDTLSALSQHCDVHLFFNNACREYWGDIIDQSHWQRLKVRERISWQDFQQPQNTQAWLSDEQIHTFEQNGFEQIYDEKLQVGNPLLSSWGKLGRDYLYLLTELEANEINAYVELSEKTLLSQVQALILDLVPSKHKFLNLAENDRSLTFHSCYSPIREVQALQDYLLHLFNQAQDLTPKDVVVMVADIDKYAPYIQAVFSQGEHYIPYSIADSKLSENDPLVSAFLQLLNLKESLFSAEEVLTFLDHPVIRQSFNITLEDLAQIRHWVEHSGIRFGLEKYPQQSLQNYNAWQAGLERMLLGFAMREENGLWLDTLGFDDTYGLKGQLVGYLKDFITRLYQWHQFLQVDHVIEKWEEHLIELMSSFFVVDGMDIPQQYKTTFNYLIDTIQQLTELILDSSFQQEISAEVIYEVFVERLKDIPNSLKFLMGKVTFCTLLPMRSIPFKVVCLLGMNDGDYPRQQTPNSFDLMQYHRKKGDRFRRDDDRYLFLEALISAQQYFYVSYIGRSIIDDSEREPSVLVTQLLDYIAENINAQGDLRGQDILKKSLIQQHAMTAFSRENFTKRDRSFSKQWLVLANKKDSGNLANFLQPINDTEIVKEISLNDLIAFIQDPVRYFFEQKLRVFLRKTEQNIADTENFTLDNLELYQIKEELIYLSEQEWEDFFARMKIKGIMPQGAFAKIYQQKTKNEIITLKSLVTPYLDQISEQIPVDLSVETEYGKVCLTGSIDSLYHQKMRRVTWRASAVKTKDIIQTWIYYLLQTLVGEPNSQVEHYALDSRLSFEKIEKSTALQQLQTYVESYLLGQVSVLLMPMKNFDQYLQLLFTPKSNKWKEEKDIDLSACFELLSELGSGRKERNFYVKTDPYWQRILAQTKLEDSHILEINQRVIQWFDLMLMLKRVE
ncbi:exodeoxyribonuclease V subunit gamma [Histophilus somni]|uniref:exodeoxyribonuclease V subunit gamma n=1 Tax=Histophilus somni TaxID=731 RepID=UPI00094B1F89|nr:exodeoxyribonuclease V subunit gamma [Histophilus somni]